MKHYGLAAIDFAHRQSRQLVPALREPLATIRGTRCLKGTEK
ncbi:MULTISPECIES: hypothetical protein [Mycobacterium]|nr:MULTISPECIES: hypothetical protein [Mycobacterium]MDP7727388.1 hypothetical protein [Mycobacterium sp. TY813]